MLRIVRAFWHDQRGIALILVSIMLPVIIGFSLLAIDASRMNNLHNDLQKGADAMALASAAELDGKSDSITRADRALGLVSNQYNFSGAGSATQDLATAGITRRYLRSLPASDSSPIAAANVIIDEVAGAVEARFVEVAVTPVGFSAIFPASFINGNNANNYQVGADAVAGFRSSVCDFTPMFICNPFGDGEDGLNKLAQSLTGHKRAMIALKTQKSGQYGPGNYGFLQTPDGDLATPKITEMFASTKPKACYGSEGVNTRPGNIPPVNDGINTRFDIYPGGNKYDPATYPPARNVLKGMDVKNAGKSSCDYVAGSPAASYMAEPHDTCLPSCATNVPDKLGDGNWDRPTYFSVNHPGKTVTSVGLDANASRYEVYTWEFNNPAEHGAEQTTPQCNTGSADPKRRLIDVAILDCSTLNVSGSGGNYPVQTFASFFLTEPAGGPPNADIYGEIVDITGRGGQGTLDNFLRNEVQLYR
ncbi:TadE/TadG family type IV pilus assembly protein [Mesorhizobium sp. ES1-4]|uniref:TadE/TadG family type IV pilus assembly protein n=1 Tax=Mesorhizobium sp. ES1-4 TaxID=2876627 RepID=UPI001CCE676F|nr:pilus assembly protein TadG-related protein [Mesorhizobium sp. ES1-4]MBZ9800025.1 pilus assembly protein TadG-related protein [Mesorhizobium sp. ES1-4]